MADPLSSFTGISSGMDWRGLVDQLMKLERRPADRLQAAIDANTKRKETLGQLQTQLQALKDAADWVAGRGAIAGSPFEAFTVSADGVDANGRSVLAAAASAGATPGTYAIGVTTLASAHKLTGGSNVATAWTLGGTETRQLTLTREGGGAPFVSIDVLPTDGLAQIRDKINAKNTGASPSGVQASIINVSATEQRLVLTSTTTGAAQRFVVGDDGASGLADTLGLDPDTFVAQPTLLQQGRDAAFTVDGIPMTRATNSVGDVIPGVTLTLSAQGSSTVAVTRQSNVASDAVKSFVAAYNKVVETVVAQGKDPKSTLFNDGLLRTVRSGLAGIVVAGATPASAGGTVGVTDDLTTLAALGVSLQKDGTLSFDSSKFTAAADTRLADVEALLGDRMQALATYADDLARPLTGLLDQRESSLDAQSARYTDRIADIDGRIEKRRAALIAQYAKFEATLGRLQTLGDQMSAQFAGLIKNDDD